MNASHAIEQAMIRNYLAWDGKDPAQVEAFANACAAENVPIVITQLVEDGLRVLVIFAHLEAAKLLATETALPDPCQEFGWRYIMSAVYDNEEALAGDDDELDMAMVVGGTVLSILTRATNCGPLLATALYSRFCRLDDCLRTLALMASAPEPRLAFLGRYNLG